MDQAFPLVLDTASDQKLGGAKAWEQGYVVVVGHMST